MNVSPHDSAGSTGNLRARAVHGWLALPACLLAGGLWLVAGCQAPATFPNLGLADVQAANYSTNLLHEGDMVSVTFMGGTNFNTVQKIPLDGMLDLAGIGPVKAAGRTIAELQIEVARLYKPRTGNDVLTVKLASSADSVYISGAVIRPGKVPMERPMTALEAIMEAGGFDPNRAKLSQVIVLRLEAGKQKTYHLNLKQTLEGGNEEPFYLKPFDIVHVPIKIFNL